MNSSIIHKVKSWRNELSHKHVFVYFVLVNLTLYIERGIIPGSNLEFVSFVKSTINPINPDVYVGLLQSAFLAGLSVSSPIIGHILNKFNCKYIILSSLIVWQISVFFTAFSGWVNSYYLLLISRVCSGVGEAAFISFVPTYIMKNGGSYQGRWLAAFFFMLPLGASIGFGYGAVIANSTLGWPTAFILIDLLTLFSVIFLIFIPNNLIEEVDNKTIAEKPLEDLYNHDKNMYTEPLQVDQTIQNTKPISDKINPTFLSELKTVLSSFRYWCMLGNTAAYSAAIISLQTFISPFVLELGFLDSETYSSMLLGGVVALAGILGTLLGGFIADFASFTDQGAIEYHNEEIFKFMKFKYESLTEATISHIMISFLHNAKLSKIACLLSLLGCCLMLITPFMRNLYSFVAVPFLGLTFIFSTVAFNNILIMLSVPRANRPFAIALSVLAQHILGDVPAQIIVGYIKDVLAPACILSGDRVIISDDCKKQNMGIRITILIISSWFLWMSLTFLVSWFLNFRQVKKIMKITSLHVLPTLSSKIF